MIFTRNNLVFATQLRGRRRNKIRGRRRSERVFSRRVPRKLSPKRQWLPPIWRDRKKRMRRQGRIWKRRTREGRRNRIGEEEEEEEEGNYRI